MNIKRFIPARIKRFLWFLYKAPQRSWVGKETLDMDLKAWKHVFTKKRTYNRISVCVGIKNRTPNLLRLIDSLNSCDYNKFIDLSICDCGSDDVPDLLAAITERWKGPLIYTSDKIPFSRSLSFNRAIKSSRCHYILACDADMTVPKDIIKKVSKYVDEGYAWFPEVWYMNQDGSGRYYTESTGMMACLKSDFEKTGGYDESITEWGKEDWLLFFEFYKKGIACLRTRERRFVHHWHPSLKPADFKPLF